MDPMGFYLCSKFDFCSHCAGMLCAGMPWMLPCHGVARGGDDSSYGYLNRCGQRLTGGVRSLSVSFLGGSYLSNT